MSFRPRKPLFLLPHASLPLSGVSVPWLSILRVNCRFEGYFCASGLIRGVTFFDQGLALPLKGTTSFSHRLAP
jgi:hypothetical protein